MMRRTGLVLGALATFAFLCALYELAARSLTLSSDQTVILLQAHSVVSGNLLLGGWHVPADSFLSLTILVYALAERIIGFDVTLINVMPPLLYAVMVALMVLLTVSALPRRPAVIAGVVTLLVIGLPASTGPAPGVDVLLTEHVETIAAVAAAWLLFHYAVGTDGAARNSRWRVVPGLLSLIVLMAAALADPFVYFLLVVPVLVLSGVECARHHAVRRHLLLAAWALCGAAVGSGLSAAMAHLGGYDVVRLALHPASPSEILSNLKLFTTYLAQVSGADVIASGLGPAQLAFAVVRLLMLLYTVYAVVWTLIAWLQRRQAGGTVVMLSLAALILTAALIFSRELTPGAERYLEVLAIIATPVAAVRLARSLTTHWQRGRRVALLTALGVAYAGSFAPALTARWDNPYPSLAAWLQQQGLTVGVSDYWYAAMVSAQSDGAVTTIPVFAHARAIQPQLLLADSSWLHDPPPASQRWFALWPQSSALGGIDVHSTTAAFGPPAALYDVSGFVVGVWNTNIVAVVDAAYAAAPPGSVPIAPYGVSEGS